jgi:hypothetical protein
MDALNAERVDFPSPLEPGKRPMMTDTTSLQPDADSQAHRKFAVDLFNFTWDLIDKKDRTPEEDDTMIHAAHASRFHWSRVGTALNLVIGEWQVSRVYAVLQRPQAALYHATRSREICEAHDIKGFHLAEAYEALARAHAGLGHAAESARCLRIACEMGEQLEDQEDRDVLFADLATVPVVAPA